MVVIVNRALLFLWLYVKVIYIISHYMGDSMDTNSLVLSQEEAEQMQKEDMEFVTALYGSDYVNKMLATTQSEAKEIDSTINKRIVQIRKSKKISQIELAKNAGISVNSLRLYEAGKRSPTFATLQKIADALGVHYSILLTDDPEEQALFTNDSDTTRVHMLRGNIVARELYSGQEKKLTPKEIETYQREIALFEGLIEDYKALSIEGQQVAAERVHELTEIPRYQRKDTSEE